MISSQLPNELFLGFISDELNALRLILVAVLPSLQLLGAAQSIFADFLSQPSRSRISPDISQLLVVLSDGRGVFADGSLVRSISLQRCRVSSYLSVLISSGC